MVGEYVLPPGLFVHFLQLDVNTFLVLCMYYRFSNQVMDLGGSTQTNCPGALLYLHILAEFAIEDGFLALKTY